MPYDPAASLVLPNNLETTMVYTRVSVAKLREVHARCHPAEHRLAGRIA